MLIAVVGLATILMVVWLLLLGMVSNEDWIAAARNKVLDNMQQIDKLRMKDAANAVSLQQYHGIAAKAMSLFLGGTSEKEITKIEKQNEALQKGNLRSVSM